MKDKEKMEKIKKDVLKQMKEEAVIPIELIWEKMDNKYRAILRISSEAERLREIDPSSDKKPILDAIEKFIKGEEKEE